MAGMARRVGEVTALRSMTPGEVRDAVDAFPARYIEDWNQWLAVRPDHRAELFGMILRRWQANRPRKMRRIRAEATHAGPYLEDLLEMARQPVHILGDLTVTNVGQRTAGQDAALRTLWDLFAGLSAVGTATCVGITKSVLLLTDGRIGPAFDKQVRSRTRLPRQETSHEWIGDLELIAEDIAAFEAAHGPLAKVVSRRFAHLADGRLYDMALGPRGVAEI